MIFSQLKGVSYVPPGSKTCPIPQTLQMCVQKADFPFWQNPGRRKPCLCFSSAVKQLQQIQATLPPRAKRLRSAERRHDGDLGSSVCLLFSGKTFTWQQSFSFLQKFWESIKTNTCTTCKTKSTKLIQYVLHPVKASLYSYAEGKYDEQDTSVFIPIPWFFGKINQTLKLQSM